MGVGAIFVSTLALTRLPTPQSPPKDQAEHLAATLQTIVSFVVLGSIIIRKDYVVFHNSDSVSVPDGLSIPFFTLGENVKTRTLSMTRTWTSRGANAPEWLLSVRSVPTHGVTHRDAHTIPEDGRPKMADHVATNITEAQDEEGQHTLLHNGGASSIKSFSGDSGSFGSPHHEALDSLVSSRNTSRVGTPLCISGPPHSSPLRSKSSTKRQRVLVGQIRGANSLKAESAPRGASTSRATGRIRFATWRCLKMGFSTSHLEALQKGRCSSLPTMNPLRMEYLMTPQVLVATRGEADRRSRLSRRRITLTQRNKTSWGSIGVTVYGSIL